MDGNAIILTGLLTGALGLFTYGHPWASRCGLLMLMASAGGLGMRLGGGWGALLGLLPLALLPWVLITLQARTMRLPLRRGLSGRLPPARDVFPHLPDLTEELETEGFTRTDDAGWDGGEEKHFMRLLYHEASRTQAAICLIEHGEAGLFYVSLTTRAGDGRVVITSDCPVGAHLKNAPGVFFRRESGDGTVAGLVLAHEAWLQQNLLPEAGREPMDTETLADRVNGERQQQVEHNVSTGILEDSGSGLFRYSWRGCLYLWGQFLKDIVKAA